MVARARDRHGYALPPEALPNDVAECLDLARRANTFHDLERERRVLEQAATVPGEPRDRADVERRLAVLDWKYHARFTRARRRLERLVETGVEEAETWLALARLEHARKRWRALGEAAERALATAEREIHERQALVRWAQAVIEPAVELRLAGRSYADEEGLAARHAALRDYVARHSGYLTSSRQLLRSALLLGDGESALLAWRSYLHQPAGAPPPNAIAAAAEQLSEILPTWHGLANRVAHRVAQRAADRAATRELTLALAGSRFFLEAALVARDPKAPPGVLEDAEVAAVLAYEQYVRELEDVIEEHYRRVSVGEGDPEAFRATWEERTREVVRRTAGDGSPATRDLLAGLAFLERRFGLHVRRADGTHLAGDLFMGHALADETRTVEQYGHRAEVRFVVLDLMVSNGFHSWAWESGAKNGGWGHGAGIWQVRPSYVQGPLTVWRRLRSEQERTRFLSEMEKETRRDEERARADPYAHLPGLAMRLHYRGVLELLEGLERSGHEGEELRLGFLAAYRRAIVESNLFAHEARHVIDARRGEAPEPWRRELDAKLSQIAFAPAPRLAFLGILLDNLGDGTAHGDANLAIVRGLVAWMEEHAEEIAGLEPERPVLPQLDRLTPEQLRAAARSLDPLARDVTS